MKQETGQPKLPAVFTEMLRTFVEFGGSLNLAQTASAVGATRQTVHRHVKELETIKRAKLIVLENRRYELTPEGRSALPQAQHLLSQCEKFVSGHVSTKTGLDSIHLKFGRDGWFYAQQHPTNTIWTSAPPLLRRGLKDWSKAESMLEHKALQKIRPYLLVYRKHAGEWLCIEVGNKSSYASWMGLSYAKSNIGRALSVNGKYREADSYMISAYDTAMKSGGHWYDHVCAKFPRGASEKPSVVSYQRLVSACCFPDGSPAVIVLVARTNSISIEQLDPSKADSLPGDMLMEFDI
ncbi:MAG: LysR family transcriptional regulator [Pseudomonadota bacterium]